MLVSWCITMYTCIYIKKSLTSLQRIDLCFGRFYEAAIAKLNFRENPAFEARNKIQTLGIAICWRAVNTEIMICIYDSE